MLNKEDLRCYTINNYILNRSFVSTSKDRTVATMFSGFEQNQNSTQISVLFKYNIQSDRTGLDIECISSIEDEKEVIILPFSVFQVKDRKEIYSNESSQILHEIHLEEYHNDQIQQGNRYKLSHFINNRFKFILLYTFVYSNI